MPRQAAARRDESPDTAQGGGRHRWPSGGMRGGSAPPSRADARDSPGVVSAKMKALNEVLGVVRLGCP